MEETRETGLDRGYNDLAAGRWQQARTVFEEILLEFPGDGLSCLGKAMADRQIHSREELAENWNSLMQDPVFQAELHKAHPDFILWLRKDMEKAMEEASPQREEQPQIRRDERELVRRFGLLKPENKVYCYSLASQLTFYLLAAFFIGKGTGSPDNWTASLAADLVIALILSGLPMLLSGIYGRSILREGRFCRALKILNNIAAVLGAFFCLIMVLGGLTALGSGSVTPWEDIFFSFAFAAAFFNYLLALIFPMVLKRAKGKTDRR